jgi:hypothetical protein
MFKKINKKVKLGDQFIELGNTNSTWEVVGIIDNPYLPPHVRIKKMGIDGIHLTSVSALLDKALFKPSVNEHVEPNSVAKPELQGNSHETM